MVNDSKVAAKLAGDGVKEIIVREGDALIIRETKKVQLEGTVSAPSEFYKKRKSEHHVLGSHVLFNKDKGTIVLIVDEKDYYHTTVTGTLEEAIDLKKFGINTTKTFTVKELMTFLKMNRFHFLDKDANMKIVNNLQKFSANVTQALVDESSTRGDMTQSLAVKVTTNLDLNFSLKMPIYKGFKEHKFQVEICFEIRDKAVSIWLESVELKELMDAEKENIFKLELENFKDIVCIEQ